MADLLIVGLGNPGPEYHYTRHNVGFLYLDHLAEEEGVSWHNKNKFKALVSDNFDFGGVKAILCKPQTYMNLSGESVQAIASFYKIPPNKIVVIHDDIDLKSAQIKEKFSGGNAGHNGLKSIESKLGRDFHRIRIGVGRPSHPDHAVADYVLEKFSIQEWDLISKEFANVKRLLANLK